MSWFSILLIIGIVAVSLLAALLSLRQSRGTERGSLPGKGDHVIEVHYSSGAGGGGEHGRFTVPCDPQEYAKRFVPRETRK